MSILEKAVDLLEYCIEKDGFSYELASIYVRTWFYPVSFEELDKAYKKHQSQHFLKGTCNVN